MQFSFCSDIGIIYLHLSVVACLGKPDFPSYLAKDVYKEQQQKMVLWTQKSVIFVARLQSRSSCH